MQSLGSIAPSAFLSKAQKCRYKLEIYDGTNWIDVSAYLKSISCNPSGAGPTPDVKGGTWSAELKDTDGIFHPLHPTSIYAGLLQIGRKIRISIGGVFGGTAHYWQRLVGYMNDPVFSAKTGTVALSGDDYAKHLEDFTLNWPDNYWGDIAIFDSISSSGVTGSEMYAEGDAADTLAEADDPGAWTGALTVVSVADTGAGSAYALQFTRELPGAPDYAHESDVADVVVGAQYFISFKAKTVTGTGWTLRVYQTVGGTLTLIETFYLDSSGSWAAHGARITALKTGALEMRVTQSSGATGDECRVDQISIKLYEAAWNTYQLPAECNGPYYVTLGQFAQVGNSEIFTPTTGTTYNLSVKYKRVSGAGDAWLGVYQMVASVLTLLAKVPLTSTSWATKSASFETQSANAIQLRYVSEDGEEDDEIRFESISVRAQGSSTELYTEADAMDPVSEANNVTNWAVLSGCTFESEADTSGGGAYVAVFKRTGSFNEQVTQGSRDKNGDWDGWLYDDAAKLFKFDQDRYVENGTDNLNIYYYTSQAPENMVARILWKAGYYSSEAAALAAMDYTATGVTIDRPRFDEGTGGLEAIRMICERVNYRFWFGYDGTPHFLPAPTAKATPDFSFASYGDLSSHDYQQDLEQLANYVVIEGDEQEPFAGKDDQRGTTLQGSAWDQESIDEYGVHHPDDANISNQLFQDQASIVAMCAALLEERKDPKWYTIVTAPFFAAPLEIGDTIAWTVPVGGTAYILQGVIQELSLDRANLTCTVEVSSAVLASGNALLDGEIHYDTEAAVPTAGAMIVGDGDPEVELEAAAEGETALLDGSEHTDTEAAAPEVGGLIVAAAASGEPVKWRKLSPGDEGQVLKMVSGLPTWSTPTGGGTGDMLKVTYDPDADGQVEKADDADTLGGHAPSYFEVAGAAAAERADHEADYAHDNLPTAGEKAALAGTSGTPGSANKYVTDEDPRLTLGGLQKWLDEDFEDLTVGDISGQGSYDGISSWAHDFSGSATAQVVSSGGKFLRLYQPAITATDKKQCYINFTDIPGLNWVRIHIKWKISDADKSGDAGLQIIASDGSTVLFHLYFQQSSSKLVAYNGTNNYTVISSVADDTYYEIDMFYCLLEASGTGYAQIWVDGTYAGRFPGRGTAAYCPQRMSFFVGNAVHSLESSLTIDDLKVWSLFRV